MSDNYLTTNEEREENEVKFWIVTKLLSFKTYFLTSDASTESAYSRSQEWDKNKWEKCRNIWPFLDLLDDSCIEEFANYFCLITAVPTKWYAHSLEGYFYKIQCVSGIVTFISNGIKPQLFLSFSFTLSEPLMLRIHQ